VKKLGEKDSHILIVARALIGMTHYFSLFNKANHKRQMENVSGVDAEVYVTVKSTEINTNNHQQHSPFRITSSDGVTPFTLNREVSKGVPQCDLCYRKFKVCMFEPDLCQSCPCPSFILLR
jgi:hypothetical protein